MSGLNGVRGEVRATLGGAERRLCLTLGALAEIETELGVAGVEALAARLRALGDRILGEHLAGQVGRVHRVLTEGTRVGRTEQFTEVAFAADQPEGAILEVRVSGQDGARLLA